MSAATIIDTFRAVTRNDDVPVTLPLPGHKIPVIGFLMQYAAMNKTDAQSRKIAKNVEGAHPEKKADARREVLFRLELKNQIFKEGQKRSYYTIALCAVCCFLGIFPTLSLIVAVYSTFSIAAVHRSKYEPCNFEVQALKRGNAEDNEFLRKIQLGGLI